MKKSIVSIVIAVVVSLFVSSSAFAGEKRIESETNLCYSDHIIDQSSSYRGMLTRGVPVENESFYWNQTPVFRSNEDFTMNLYTRVEFFNYDHNRIKYDSSMSVIVMKESFTGDVEFYTFSSNGMSSWNYGEEIPKISLQNYSNWYNSIDYCYPMMGSVDVKLVEPGSYRIYTIMKGSVISSETKKKITTVEEYWYSGAFVVVPAPAPAPF